MSGINIFSSLHYIVDAKGNYYRVDSADQLVATVNRDEAGVFSFVEANQRIGGGRKANFYSVIAIDDTPDEYESESEHIMDAEDSDEGETDIIEMENSLKHIEDCHEGEGDYRITEASNGVIRGFAENITQKQASAMKLPYDLRGIDWKEYMTHFAYVISEAEDYHTMLNKKLSNVDMMICDILHYVELYDMREEDMCLVMDKLKECREYRRDIKDEMFCVETFQKAIGNSVNESKAKSGAKQIDKLKYRKYNPRLVEDLFQLGRKKTVRPNRLTEEYQQDMDDEAGAENFMPEKKEIKEKILDIDKAIEELMSEIDNSNYNVVQGYNVYKNLKILREQRKCLIESRAR